VNPWKGKTPMENPSGKDIMDCKQLNGIGLWKIGYGIYVFI